MTTWSTGTARPASSGPLATAWVATAVVVTPVGALLFALSEAAADRLLGLVLAAAGVLAGATGLTVLAAGRTLRAWSLGLSGAHVVLGVVAAAVVLTGPGAFVQDAALVALPPLVGGVVTGLLGRRP